jgi:PIN domain nuclease of toxin-antitoxin system
VRLLLDTHVVLWWRLDSRRLGRTARSAIASATSVYVSAASAWEVAIKVVIGRLRLEASFAEHVAAAGFEELPILFTHAAEAGVLPPHHADPFDRMLIAQARVDRLTLVTHDRIFESYDVQTLRA